jgi:L-histidine Nalpha-methyltransferase
MAVFRHPAGRMNDFERTPLERPGMNLYASAPHPRLTINTLHSGNGRLDFSADVLRGLSARPKWLHPMYLYDSEGSMLFERISRLPEYYVTRIEHEILQGCAAEIAACSSECMNLVEFGSGSSGKTKLLIEALLHQQESLCYIPVDISFSIVRESAQRLIRESPRLCIAAQIAEYNAGLARLMDADPGQKLIVFMGSNLGNFDTVQAVDFLVSVRKSMSAADYFVIGNDLSKDPSILIPAYDDAQGVTAAFNLNILQRINRELGGHFDLSLFDHTALYNSRHRRIEMHLRSNKRQTVLIRNLNMAFEFEKEETIHTENSYKYSIEQLDTLFRTAGFTLVKRWCDAREWFSISLLRAASE